MIKKTFFLFLLSISSFAQSSLKQLLKKYNQETIPYIYVNDINTNDDETIFLDAREKKEFEISHLKKATYVGYNNFNLKRTLKELPKDKNSKIIVYCSLGVRSEDIAEKIKAAGYTNVFNLYGGIFEWKNNEKSVYDSQNKLTNKVHAFDKEWGTWLNKGIKVYE
ncbi:rhodanese-like domain-containing protein [Tenacibaculum sp. M341]|uniref:rhodanese-like domain-containing protein n=1 Tax=Tenacibaculum sp. M341 TaxID=2530339 RepID=UPI001046B2A1|nr:rhodanese-like domain-containing protein [Tenacibaculum sp. M341]TCI84934.1 rhodanese-like domain-containing protein [Tenacibaculum sp. M341]